MELIQGDPGLGAWLGKREPKRILELCTGSGCLAILLAQRYAESRVSATDISSDALDVAEHGSGLTANGLASCAQGALSHHAEIVHRELGVGDDHKLLFGIAFGYEDPAHPANSARTVRDKDHVLHG